MNPFITRIYFKEFDGTYYDVSLKDLPLHMMREDDIIDIIRSDAMNSTRLTVNREFNKPEEELTQEQNERSKRERAYNKDREFIINEEQIEQWKHDYFTNK